MPRHDDWDISSLDAAQKYLDRITREFVTALRGCWLAFTRYPHSDQWLLHRATDEFLEQARLAIGRYVDRDHDRPHSGLAYRTPNEVAAPWREGQSVQNSAV